MRKEITLYTQPDGAFPVACNPTHEALEDDSARAREFLVLIAGLYLIEREAREGGFTPEARAALRQEKVPALLERLHRQLLELEPDKAIR